MKRGQECKVFDEMINVEDIMRAMVLDLILHLCAGRRLCLSD